MQGRIVDEVALDEGHFPVHVHKDEDDPDCSLCYSPLEALLFSCKSLSAFVLPHWWGTMEFEGCTNKDLRAFIFRNLEKYGRLVRHILIRHFIDDEEVNRWPRRERDNWAHHRVNKVYEIVEGCPNLRSLDIDYHPIESKSIACEFVLKSLLLRQLQTLVS